jgi:L-fucose mutarotase/ribose pyranase (RbsD/FucU family)
MAKEDVDVQLNVEVWPLYQQILNKANKGTHTPMNYLKRMDFYERAKGAYAIVQTGYLNFII